MSQSRLMIYGATGFTGGLIVGEAVARGLDPVLAGRSRPRIEAAAAAHGRDGRVFQLDDPAAIDAALGDIAVVLNCAGPFIRTFDRIAAACLRTGTHYLDITGEVDVLEGLAGRDADARAARIMLMPGVGFDVVPSDCLIAGLASRFPDGRFLRLGLAGLTDMSRGTARTVMDNINNIRIRRNGRLTRVAAGSLRHDFDFGAPPGHGLISAWGDVATTYRSTGIANIETYFQATAQVILLSRMSRMFGWLLAGRMSQIMLNALIDRAPAGPSESARASGDAILVAEIEDAAGDRVAARLRTPEPYALTARTAVAIAARVLDGAFTTGYQTPSQVYGADFILRFDGVQLDRLNRPADT